MDITTAYLYVIPLTHASSNGTTTGTSERLATLKTTLSDHYECTDLGDFKIERKVDILTYSGARV
jgi:hypothetical protein